MRKARNARARCLKRSGLQPSAGQPQSHPPTSDRATPDGLISPFVQKLAHILATQAVTAEDRAKPVPGTWARIPDQLLPFLESPSVTSLAGVLREHPALYWHPIVYRQVIYLARLRWNEEEWRRLGWEQEWDEYGSPEAPKEV